MCLSYLFYAFFQGYNSEFELNLFNYIHFWINAPGKGMSPLIPLSAMG